MAPRMIVRIDDPWQAEYWRQYKRLPDAGFRVLGPLDR